MGQVHHLLSPPEDALLRCLRDLAGYRRSFDDGSLAAAENVLATHCIGRTAPVISQALLLGRMLEGDGFVIRALPSAASTREFRFADDEEMRLLAMLEAAQSSRSRLEPLLAAAVPNASAELLFVMIRFAALLLSAGLRLPRRDVPVAPVHNDAVLRRSRPAARLVMM